MSNYDKRRIFFSDESNYTALNPKNQEIVRRYQNEKYNNRFIVPKLQGGGGSVGIWGCIRYDAPGLHVLYNSQMDQHRYIHILENYLMPTKDIFFGNEPDWMF